MQAIDILEILPELILLLVICFILLVTPFFKENEVNDEDVFFTPNAAGFAYQLTLLTLLVLAIMFAMRVGDLPVRIMNGLYIVDPFSNVLKAVSAIAVMVTLIYSKQYFAYAQQNPSCRFIKILSKRKISLRVIVKNGLKS